jgi:anti-sigma factor ChrR (cupin superfamily)
MERITMKMNSLICSCALLFLATCFATQLHSQTKPDPSHVIVKPSDLKWTPIIKGCDVAAVQGNPDAEGSNFVIRLRCNAGSQIPAHWHPTDENITVLKGVFQVGMGDKFDQSKLTTMSVGDFASMPKEMRHYAFSKTDTVVQVHGAGPFKVNWVNPADVVPPDAKPKS